MYSDIGENKILLDLDTRVAFNSELLDRNDAKEYLRKNYNVINIQSLAIRRAVELGHIFQLGTKYSKVLNANYIDENGKPKQYVMGCYGIGVSRTIAMIYEKSIIRTEKGNFEGIALPVNIAPYLLYIIPKDNDLEKVQCANYIYQELSKRNVKVLFDDRSYLSIGARIKDSKMVGVPYTAVLGRTLEKGYIEVENNKTKEKINLSVEDLINAFAIFQNNKNETLEELIKKF